VILLHTEDGEVNLLMESYYSEAGGSHPRHCSITWTSTHLSLSSQPQEGIHGGDKFEDTTLSSETQSSRQQSRS